jgi:hypothetical protein
MKIKDVITEGAYEDGVRDGINDRVNPRASSIYGPESEDYRQGFLVGLKKGEEERQGRVAQSQADAAEYENMSTEELEQMLADIQQRSTQRQAIYSKLRGADYSFDPKRHVPPNHAELAAQNTADNKAWNIIHQVLGQRKRQGVAEGSSPFGNKCAGSFASEERAKREASRISKELGVKRYVEKTSDGKYIVVKKQGVAETNVSKHKKLGATKDTTHFIKNTRTGEVVSPHRSRQDAEDSLVAYGRTGDGSDYKIVRAKKHGMAEADQLPGTPVVSLSDLDDKDTKKNRYGQTVPKKLKQDDPRVKFHRGNYSDEANPIKDDGNEGRPGKQRYPGMMEGNATMWEVSFDYGPHMTKIVKIKASSEDEARAKVEKAASKKPEYSRGIMINSATPVEQGVAKGFKK